jgi:hypothetical protein
VHNELVPNINGVYNDEVLHIPMHYQE